MIMVMVKVIFMIMVNTMSMIIIMVIGVTDIEIRSINMLYCTLLCRSCCLNGLAFIVQYPLIRILSKCLHIDLHKNTGILLAKLNADINDKSEDI